MRPSARDIWLLMVAIGVTAAAQIVRADATYPAVSIPGSELRTMKSTSTGRTYDLYIRTPADYGTASNRRYPVLYLLDGQWDFKLLDSVVGGLVYDKWMPDIIVVGITYSGAHADYDGLRAMDYTPVAGSATGSGDGPKFLGFLKTELIPFVESNFRADPSRRILAGHSLGGLFTLYAMFSDPSFFWGYIAGSPAFTYGDEFVAKQEAAYAEKHRELPVRLFVGVGGAEPLVTPGTKFVRTLASRNYGALHWDGRVIEGERHSGVKPELYNRALRFIFGTE